MKALNVKPTDALYAMIDREKAVQHMERATVLLEKVEAVKKLESKINGE